MTPAIKKAFLKWIIRYSGTKDKCHEPWASAPDSVITHDLRLPVSKTRAGAKSSKLGVTVLRAVHELKSGRHYAAFSNGRIVLEYHSSKDNRIEVISFDLASGTLSAGIINYSEESDSILYEPGTSIIPMGFNIPGSESSSSGVSVLIVMMLAAIAGRKSLRPITETIEETLARILPIKDKEEISDDFIQDFFELSDAMYSVLNPSYEDTGWLGQMLDGISSDSYFTRLSKEDIQQLVLDSKHLLSDSRFSDSYAVDAMKFRAISETMLFADAGGLEEIGKAPPRREDAPKSIAELAEELKLDIHPLSKAEQAMVPVLDSHYVIDKTLLKAARTIKEDWKYPGLQLAPNFILEGDAGSGKTAGSRFFASVFGIPYTKMTMNPMFESANLIGAFYPIFDDMDKWSLDEADNEAIQAVAKSMGITHATSDALKEIRAAFERAEMRDIVRNAYDLPDKFECEFMPEEAWAKLGYTSEAPEVTEIIEEANRIANDKFLRLFNYMVDKASQEQVSYRFQISELMKAFQYGWLVEIQEAASVLRPGVLTELNSLLEINGRIELPNGKFITRHPDTIVFITTNRDYAGNVDLNESLRDRCMLGIKMDVPPAEVMAARAMAQTGFDNMEIAIGAANAILAVGTEAKAKNIRGSFGMRSLLAWMLDLRKEDYSEESFLQRVIYKMTTRDDDVALLMSCYRANAPKFASKGRRTS